MSLRTSKPHTFYEMELRSDRSGQSACIISSLLTIRPGPEEVGSQIPLVQRSRFASMEKDSLFEIHPDGAKFIELSGLLAHVRVDYFRVR